MAPMSRAPEIIDAIDRLALDKGSMDGQVITNAEFEQKLFNCFDSYTAFVLNLVDYSFLVLQLLFELA